MPKIDDTAFEKEMRAFVKEQNKKDKGKKQTPLTAEQMKQLPELVRKTAPTKTAPTKKKK